MTPKSAIQAPLLTCANLLAQKARLSLLTLLILMGVTWGLWQASPNATTQSTTATTRSGAAHSLCKQASVAFSDQLSVQQMGQILRAEDAYILYGPDEFGEYQLRFASHAAVPAALARMQSQPGIESLMPNPNCP